MPWFRRKVRPFEGPGRIETANPDDDPGTTELNWKVPEYYFCHLLQATVDIACPLIVGADLNWITLKCTRAQNLVFFNPDATCLVGGTTPKTVTWTPNATYRPKAAGNITFTNYLHPHCRLYPHDLVTVFFSRRADSFTISNLTLTIETWRIF